MEFYNSRGRILLQIHARFFNSIVLNSRETSILLLNEKGFIIASNTGFLKNYGYAETDLLGKHFSILFIEEDRNASKPENELSLAIKTGSAADFNYLIHKNGDFIWTQGETIYTESSTREAFFIKIVHNINEQKVLEDNLLSSLFSDKILDSLGDPVIAIDQDMKIIKANAAFYEIFQHTTLTNDFFEALKNLKGNTSQLKDALVKVTPHNIEVKDLEAEYYFPADGKRIVSISISPIIEEDKKSKRLILYFKDITREKLEKEELLKKIRLTQTILATLPAIAFTTSSDGQINYLNNYWKEYTGLSIEEGIAEGWKQVSPKEDLPFIHQSINQALSKGEATELEIRIFKKSDNIYRWNLSRVVPIRDSNENIEFWVGTLTDIHEEKTRSEQKLERVQMLLLETEKLGNVGSYERDIKTDKLNVSPQMRTIFGWEEDKQITFEDVLSRVIPSDREKVNDIIDYTIRHDHIYDIEYQIVLPDGTRKCLLSRGRVYLDASGTAERLAGTVIDISVLKGKEIQLKHTQKLLLESQGLSKTGSYELNLLTRKATCTHEFHNITGLEQGSEIDLDIIFNLIHPDYREKFQKRMRQVVSSETASGAEYKIIRPDKIEKIVLTKSKTVFNENREPVKIIGIVHDITEKKNFEDALIRAKEELEQKVRERTRDLINAIEELKKVNSDLDTFVYTASHDLKAPINNIEGLLIHLHNELETEEDELLKDLIEMMEFSVNKFKQTLADLAEIGKEKTKVEERPESLFEEVLDTIKIELQSAIKSSKASINADFSEAPKVHLSQNKLKSVMYNLVSNAIKYRHPSRSPVVFLKTENIDNNYILLSVKDNGLGIIEENHDKVFSLYSRLHDHVEGTGVGMAIVKRIVDNNGGKIEIKSKVDEGSEFRVYFRK